jgi:hypothetical protein
VNIFLPDGPITFDYESYLPAGIPIMSYYPRMYWLYCLYLHVHFCHPKFVIVLD